MSLSFSAQVRFLITLLQPSARACVGAGKRSFPTSAHPPPVSITLAVSTNVCSSCTSVHESHSLSEMGKFMAAEPSQVNNHRTVFAGGHAIAR